MLVFEKEHNQSQNYYWFENGFTKEELEIIKKSVDQIPFHEASVESGYDEARRSSIKWIPFDEPYDWIYKKLMNMAKEANDNMWGFDLISAPEMIQYTEYYHTNKGHYDWHQDIGGGMLSLRKISITVQLSDPNDYEGGDLEIWGGGNYVRTAPRGKGNVVIFPSYMMHRVTPVTKGTRTSFVLWLGGEHYR